MSDASTPEVRTLGQAVMEVRFGIEYAELHEKLWSHLDTGISMIQIVAGTVALVGVVVPEQWKWMTPFAGVVLAVLGGIQIGLKPRERSISFRDTRRSLEALNTRAWDVDVQDVDRELDRIKSEAPRGLDALTVPAQNRALQRHGYKPDPVGAWQAFLAWCAA